MRSMKFVPAVLVLAVFAGGVAAHADDEIDDVIRGRTESTWTFPVAGGFAYDLDVHQIGGPDLEISIYDESGRRLVTGKRYAYIDEWPARYNGRFTVKIVNRSRKSVRYSIDFFVWD